MSQLYLRFYLALLGSLAVFAITSAVIWHHANGPGPRTGELAGRLVQNALPPPQASKAEQAQALRTLIDGLDARVQLLAADGSSIAQAGAAEINGVGPNPGPHVHRYDGPEWTIELPDGRQLRARVAANVRNQLHNLLLSLGLLALAVGIGAYPVVRRLTQRLERLQRGVESLGAGDLSARVAVEGRDEVARLAQSFNRSAEHIEQLVAAHKSLLANTSHELRTPLARIRLAIELMKTSAEPRHRAGLERDIAELDLLIDEILLASRLDAVTTQSEREALDLLALAAEEAARYDEAQVDGVSVALQGDARLLRRLLRNLLENAAHHGVPPTQVLIGRSGDKAIVEVWDSGPPIPAEHCAQLFQPFYRRPDSRGQNGSGLGLALVRQIARHHGGDAFAIATAEHCVFRVELACGDVVNKPPAT